MAEAACRESESSRARPQRMQRIQAACRTSPTTGATWVPAPLRMHAGSSSRRARAQRRRGGAACASPRNQSTCRGRSIILCGLWTVGLWDSRRPPPATSSDRPASVTAVNVHPDVVPDELRGSVLCCVRHADLASCCPCKHGWLVVVFLYCVRHAILAPCCPQHTWLCGAACIAAAILLTHTFVWGFRVRVGALGPARAGCCWVTLCWIGGHILELLDGFMALPALPPLAL